MKSFSLPFLDKKTHWVKKTRWGKKSRCGMRKSIGERLFDFSAYFILIIVGLVTLYPFLNVLAVSLSDYKAYIENPMMLIPKNITFSAIGEVFKNELILSSYWNTIYITVLGAALDLFFITVMAYPLSKSHFKGRGVMMGIIVFTMLFNGGLIPNYYLVKSLGLIDTRWALILPRLMAAFNVVLLKNFFESIPVSLEEAAKLDGAGDTRILCGIVLPLSKPILATLTLFISVGFWNSFFEAIMYIQDPKLWTLQLLLREIIMSSNTQMLQTGGNLAEMSLASSTAIKYATLIVAILPIICVYPFLQRYFVKGVMVGAVKG
jgi:putative aldouronate transport system permease protein